MQKPVWNKKNTTNKSSNPETVVVQGLEVQKYVSLIFAILNKKQSCTQVHQSAGECSTKIELLTSFPNSNPNSTTFLPLHIYHSIMDTPVYMNIWVHVRNKESVYIYSYIEDC